MGLSRVAVSWQQGRPDRWKWAEVTETAASYIGLFQKGSHTGATRHGQKASAEL